jgi:cytochrome c oxidase subunit IV
VNPDTRKPLQTAAIALAILALLALLYWPVVHGDFVWDDVVNFRKNDWLTAGDQWKHYVFRDFNYWTYYFRPLVVAFFTFQLRMFDGAPGPMHLVSLALHLANTLFVGLLALRCAAAANGSEAQRRLLMGLAMLLFGTHPSVIETVAWVGCQYDLLLTSFMLLGLLASVAIRRLPLRAATVAACFFLAACTKESAAAFPLVLVLFAWAMQARVDDAGRLHPPPLRAFVAANAATWTAVALAGVAYLVFRHAMMGPSVMPPTDTGLTGLGHLQMVCFTYLRYWKMLFLPMAGMSPVHEFDMLQFNAVSPASIAMDVAALAIVAVSAYVAWRRGSALACIVLIVTATLLPVLRILSVAFNPNLYHDRYLTWGLAVACAMLPLLRPRVPAAWRASGGAVLARIAAAAALVAWVGVSCLAIRTTAPLWANQTTLWEWASTVSPDSNYALSNVLETHLQAGRTDKARQVADRIVNERIACADCLLNIAILALLDQDMDRARLMLRVLLINKPMLARDYRFAGVVERLREFTGESEGTGQSAR